MATITWDDKNEAAPTTDPTRILTAADLNMIKSVANGNYAEHVAAIALRALITVMDAALLLKADAAATTAALALKAALESPTFTGTPSAPTASPGTNYNTKVELGFGTGF